MSGARDATAGTANGTKGVRPYYGSFATEVPITVPRFRGLEPTIKLVYSSAGRNNFVGVGWGISGFSTIERATPGGGAPKYDSNDIFILDGGELWPCEPGSVSPSCTTGGTHSTKIESYSRITKIGDSWEITGKNGTKITYEPTFTTEEGQTFRWGIRSQVDTLGNTVNYYWMCLHSDGPPFNQCYPRRVSYNGNEVFMYHQARPDDDTFAFGTGLGTTYQRLVTIKVSVSGTLARAYKLSYETSSATQRSRLVSVTQYGKDAVITNGLITGGTSLPPMTMSYQDATPGQYSKKTWTAGTSGWNADKWRFGDINGDGKTDSVSTYNREWLETFLSDGDGTYTKVRWYTGTTAWDADHWRMGDLNGDGKADIISYDVATDKVVTFLSNGNGTYQKKLWSAGGVSAVLWNWRMGDFNGDGKMDVVAYEKATKGLWTLLSNGDGTYTKVWWNSGSAWGRDRWLVGDFNGDGLSDSITFRISSNSMMVFFSDGDGTYTKALWDVGSTAWDYSRWMVGDFNGDGKADTISYDAATNSHITFLSKGQGVFRARTFAAGTNWDANRWRTGDFNGDGKTDTISYKDGKLVTFLASGKDSYTKFTWTAGTSGWDANKWYEGDFDGDGKTDTISYAAGNQVTFLSTGPMPDLLTGLSNGIGGTSTVGYTPSSAWSNTYLPAVLQTVSSVQTCDGRGKCSTTNYQYQGGLWNDANRRFLGFRKVTGVIDGAGNYTETYYHQHVGCIAKPETTYFKKPGGAKWSYSTFVYAENSAPPYTSQLKERWDYACEGGGTCLRAASTLTYDAYGNVAQHREYGNWDVSGDERTTALSYAPNPSAYIVGMVKQKKLYQGIGTSGTMLERTLFYYDNNASFGTPPPVGKLTKRRTWNSATGAWHNEKLEYDSYGNLTKEIDARGRVKTHTVDATYHTFVTKTCNALGQCTTLTHDPVLGQPTSQRNANGDTISFAYDALGRPTVKTRPDGSTVTVSYHNTGDPAAQRTRTAVSDGTSNGLWVDTYKDGLGRVWKKVKEGGSKQVTLYSDASSRVWKISQWFVSGENARYSVTSYDGVGRPVRVTNPDGTFAERSYAICHNPSDPDFAAPRLCTRSTDELGHAKREALDGYGKVQIVSEWNGTAEYRTRYVFDGQGRAVQIIDALGNISSASYNSLGHKLASCNPDSGCQSYTYDKVGNLKTQTDAKGQTITLTVDALNRVTRKVYSTGEELTYTYDEQGHGSSIGKLTGVEFPDGTQSLAYDALGRVSSVERCVTGVCHTIGKTYDDAGRVKAISYPAGTTVSYNYDYQGRLQSIPGYVNAFAYNSRGQITSIAFANGTTQSYTYDANRQWLNSSTVKKGTITRYKASYGYDDAARVTSVSSTTDPLLNVSYSYDDLNRLTSVSGAQSQTIAYDALGRMTHNSRYGNYTYGAASHVHAVTKAGSKNYTYDANGNMLTGAGRTLTWNADNRLTSVTKGGATTSFVYDPQGRRALKTTSAGTTLYFGKLLEIKPNGQHVRRIMAGSLMVAKRAGSTKTYYHTDHLGSVQLITDASGNKVREADYAAFGETLADSNPTADDRGFGGHTTDAETGLVYMNARYYDAALGRFISADSLVPETHNPQALDRYAYAYNNPISNIDPSGHAPVVAVISAFVASVTVKAIVTWVVKKAIAMIVSRIVAKIIDNPIFNTVLSVLNGFTAGGFLGAAVAAASSPLSPLSAKVKQTIGWAYTAFNTIRAVVAHSDPAKYGDKWGDSSDMQLKVKDPGDAWNGMPIELTNTDGFLDMVNEKDLGVLLFGRIRSMPEVYQHALGDSGFTLSFSVGKEALSIDINGGWERLLSTVVLDSISVAGGLSLTHKYTEGKGNWSFGLNIATTLTAGLEKALTSKIGDRNVGLLKAVFKHGFDRELVNPTRTFELEEEWALN